MTTVISHRPHIHSPKREEKNGHTRNDTRVDRKVWCVLRTARWEQFLKFANGVLWCCTGLFATRIGQHGRGGQPHRGSILQPSWVKIGGPYWAAQPKGSTRVDVSGEMKDATNDVFCERQDATGFQNLRTVLFGVPQGCLPPKQRSGFCERVH